MHAEEDCPCQTEFIQKFLCLEGNRITEWRGWSIENKGYSVLRKIVPLGVKKLEDRIYAELCQLQVLAASIDRTLATLCIEDFQLSHKIGMSDETNKKPLRKGLRISRARELVHWLRPNS